MKPLLRAAARLYPRAWRVRYGEEFDTLIDDLTPQWRHVFNIVAGALIMQISSTALIPVDMAVAGAIAGAAVSLAMPPVYASSSWVLVHVGGTAADVDERGRQIRMAIEAALHETAFDKKAIAVTQRGDPGRDPVLLEVSASADSARTAMQAAERAMGSMIEANFVAAARHPGASERYPGVQFRAVQPANLPKTAQRDTTRNTAVGGGLGFVIGGVFAFVGRRRAAI
jgi:hypothetical protein